jgi:cytochrome oxidase Cu insertion factor (SCO1/SenC/PrrC family)
VLERLSNERRSLPLIGAFDSLPRKGEMESGAKMRITIAVLFLVGSCAFASGQEKPSANHASDSTASSSLEIGQKAPAFSLPDQFGHENSNESLKGAKGTVLLFFRSADW